MIGKVPSQNLNLVHTKYVRSCQCAKRNRYSLTFNFCIATLKPNIISDKSGADYTCWKRADASHGRNESFAIQICIFKSVNIKLRYIYWQSFRIF